MEDSKATGAHTFTTFTTGAMLGIGLGLLVAPKRGTETMADIKDVGHKASSKLRSAKDSVQKGLKETFSSSKKAAQDTQDEIATEMSDIPR